MNTVEFSEFTLTIACLVKEAINADNSTNIHTVKVKVARWRGFSVNRMFVLVDFQFLNFLSQQKLITKNAIKDLLIFNYCFMFGADTYRTCRST